MPFYYEEVGFDPDALARQVAEAHAKGKAPYRQWLWPMLGPYNGYPGEMRVLAWQMQWAAIELGLLKRPGQCSVCLGSPGAKFIDFHNEDYARPFTCKPVCKECHRKIHNRFRHVKAWKAHVLHFNRPGAWFVNLPGEDGRMPTVPTMTDGSAISGSAGINAAIAKLRGPIQRRLL